MAGERAKSPVAKKRSQPSHRAFVPTRAIAVVDDRGITDVAPASIAAHNVGCKALGLSTIPAESTRSFFIVSSRCFSEHVEPSNLNDWISACLPSYPEGANHFVIVRSSGTAETLRDRGSLISKLCKASEIASTIADLRSALGSPTSDGVHWIVQEAVVPKRKGHFSNERRVSREPRDWVVEFEGSSEYRAYAASVGIRPWREGRDAGTLDLRCKSETEITLRLRQVAKWGLQFSTRLHFEWVWDGERIWIVQADAEESSGGKNPTAMLPASLATIEVGALHVFRSAADADYARYRKLGNAALYRKFGYKMPPFLITDDTVAIGQLLEGVVTDDLERDLSQLLQRPLMIRTDGSNIPEGKWEMLPRSEPLTSLDEAKTWLLNYFRQEINRADLATGGLCLITHHFIPSVASAWARAEPDHRMVRIESLWGIPEGLYWYSHDTFEVDTQCVTLPLFESGKRDYRISERLRFKGTFVSADASGRWTATAVLPPFDWRSSVKKKDWLFEIAHTTRRVADANGHPTALMWFIGNHPEATKHEVLPWFHCKSELTGPLRAAPRRKLTTSDDFIVRDEADWTAFQQKLNDHSKIERVVVEPTDASLIRNPTFAKALGQLAATKRFVIELSGGVLSHAYYILTKAGAQVECIDLFGAEDEQIEFNKIVRDKIPLIISGRGERAEVRRLGGEALIEALRQKLVEEAFEVMDAKSGNELVAELADVSEVINALCNALKVSPAHLESVQKEKRQKRGGFEEGIMLTGTTTPHSIQQRPAFPDNDFLLHMESELPNITEPSDLPSRPLLRRPDLLQVDQQPEKLFSFVTEAYKLGELKASLHFSLPTGKDQQFSLSVEFVRSGGALRGNIRLRLVPTQLGMDFPDKNG
jgi:predicted house-cleaning noncanonical NTP pyrophosphatase (MazG superfamily)